MNKKKCHFWDLFPTFTNPQTDLLDFFNVLTVQHVFTFKYQPWRGRFIWQHALLNTRANLVINNSEKNQPRMTRWTHTIQQTHKHHLTPHWKTYTPITFNRWFYPLEKKLAEFVTWSYAYIVVYMMNIW